METLGSTYNLLTLGGNAIAILISLWMLKTIYRRVRGNKESYERLFVAYPETEYDLDVVLREATFLDEQLSILIYKDMFISYRTVFIVEYIADIQSIEINKTTGKNNRKFYHMRINTYRTKSQVVNFNKRVVEKHLKKLVDTLRFDYGIPARLTFYIDEGER